MNEIEINLERDLLIFFDECPASMGLKNSKSWFIRGEKNRQIDYSENPDQNVTLFYSCCQFSTLCCQWSQNYNESINITNFIDYSIKTAK